MEQDRNRQAGVGEDSGTASEGSAPRAARIEDSMCGTLGEAGKMPGTGGDAEAGKRQRQVLRASCVSIVYGYAKAESIATKLLSMLIFFAGAEMLISAVQHLFFKDPRVMPQAIAIYVTVFSIVCKLLLARYQTVVGKRAGSSMLVANGVNMRNDVLISLSVLAGLFFSIGLDLPVLDSVTALIVSCFIIRSAIKIFMDSNVELMDGVKDESVYQKIFDAINGVEGVGNPHRVRSRSIGGKYMITLDVEADGKLTLNQAHALASQVEQSIRETIPEVYDIVVHVEPFGTHPEEVFGINKKAK